MTRKRIDPDTLWDRPITREGADTLARRHGYRLVGFLGETPLEHLWPDAPVAHGRFMAVFFPSPDHGEGVVLADGRTRNRALRRGLEVCRITREGEAA